MHGTHKFLTEQCFSSAAVSVLNTADSALVSTADACRWHSACKPCQWLLWQQHGSPARPHRAQSRPQTCWCSTLPPGWHCTWPPGMSVTSASTCLVMTPACCPTHVSSGLTKQPRLLQRVSACKGPLCPPPPFPPCPLTSKPISMFTRQPCFAVYSTGFVIP